MSRPGWDESPSDEQECRNLGLSRNIGIPRNVKNYRIGPRVVSLGKMSTYASYNLRVVALLD